MDGLVSQSSAACAMCALSGRDPIRLGIEPPVKIAWVQTDPCRRSGRGQAAPACRICKAAPLPVCSCECGEAASVFEEAL